MPFDPFKICVAYIVRSKIVPGNNNNFPEGYKEKPGKIEAIRGEVRGLMRPRTLAAADICGLPFGRTFAAVRMDNGLG